MKLKGEVGMGGPKSIQTRFVGIIMSTIIAFLDYSYMYYVPIDDDLLVLSLTES